jgi:hypothetical protein
MRFFFLSSTGKDLLDGNNFGSTYSRTVFNVILLYLFNDIMLKKLSFAFHAKAYNTFFFKSRFLNNLTRMALI